MARGGAVRRSAACGSRPRRGGEGRSRRIEQGTHRAGRRRTRARHARPGALAGARGHPPRCEARQQDFPYRCGAPWRGYYDLRHRGRRGGIRDPASQGAAPARSTSPSRTSPVSSANARIWTAFSGPSRRPRPRRLPWSNLHWDSDPARSDCGVSSTTRHAIRTTEWTLPHRPALPWSRRTRVA